MMQALCPQRIWVLPLLLAMAMIAGPAFADCGSPSPCGPCSRFAAPPPCAPVASSAASVPATVKVYVCAREAKPHHHFCCVAAPPQAAVVPAAAPVAAAQPAMGFVPAQAIGWMYLVPQPVVQPLMLMGAPAVATPSQTVLMRAEGQPPCAPTPACSGGRTLEERVSSLERSMESLEQSVRGLKDCMTLQQDSIEQLRKRAAK